MRSFAALQRRLDPHKAYFVLEGKPVLRLNLDENYKGTRVYDKDESFHRQRKDIINLVWKHFPVMTARHPHQECDDVIGHLACKYIDEGHNVTVVSSDTDFLQLANSVSDCSLLKIYNPVRKDYRDLPEYDYVSCKALVGDGTDNIVGFKGIGPKRAQALLADPVKMIVWLNAEKGRREKFEKNVTLVRFIDLSNEEGMINISRGDWKPDDLRLQFENRDFNSIVSKKGWPNFVSAFECLQEGTQC